MSRAALLRSMIERGDNKLTCGFIWSGKDSLAKKWTQAVSELREKLVPEGKDVVYHREKTSSDSWYSIEPIEIKAFTDPETGQREMADMWESR